ncbi:MAG: hypothetical protein H0X64_03375 [Gemmatimonadaceae bacterium]|nr:hypothetical protein [Gemmatimonadaceae bacterium]
MSAKRPLTPRRPRVRRVQARQDCGTRASYYVSGNVCMVVVDNRIVTCKPAGWMR